MYVQLGDTIILPFNTSDATGASVAADSTPTVVIAVNGTGVIGYAPSVVHTSLGDYYAVLVLTSGNGFSLGQACAVWIHATVGGIAGSMGIESIKIGPTPVDLSTVATASALSTVATAVSALPSASSIVTAVLDAARSGHLTPGSIGEGIALSTALAQGNYMIDNVDNTSDPNGPVTQRLRCWVSAAAMSGAAPGGAGAQGAFATFAVATAYVGPNKIASHTVVQQ